MKFIIAGVISVVVCSAIPVAVSAQGRGFGEEPRGGYLSDTVREGRSTGEKSDDSMPHDLAPSPSISPSVDGHSQRQGPWWDRRPSGDPSVRDLSRMDGGGFAPPGSYTGSERRQ